MVVSGIVLLVAALVLSLAVASTQIGAPPPGVEKALSSVSKVVGFSFDHSPLGLIPFALMLFVWSGMCFSFRRKKPFSLVFIPLSALMFYTLFLLAHMLQQSPRPAFLQKLLYSFDAEPRVASLRVVLAFLVEMALFVGLTLIGDGIERRSQKREAFHQVLALARSGEQVDLEDLSPRERRTFKRAQKKFEKEHNRIPDEEESVRLHKKPVEPEVDILSDEQVSFPPIVDVPVLDRLHKKRQRIPKGEHILDVEEQPAFDVGVVSIGALEAIKEERDRNKGISYLEMKQHELQEKRKQEQRDQEKSEQEQRDAEVRVQEQHKNSVKNKTKNEKEPVKKPLGKLSGFLQGALEAVGKSSSSAVDPKPEPTGKAWGMLADAVASKEKSRGLEAVALGVRMPQSKDEDQPLRIRERILSVRPPVFVEPVKSTPMPPEQLQAEALHPGHNQPENTQVELPKQAEQVKSAPSQGISSFAPQSTARPINGGFSEDAPVVVEVSDEEDKLEVASGVGGLAITEGSGSALINRSRITYQYPPESILVTYPKIGNEINEETLERGRTLVATLEQFNVHVELTNIVRGPTVTMLEILPAPGVRVNTIVNLADNIAMALAAKQVRIVAPIPGKSAVGIEIPNHKRDIIGFKEMLPAMESKQFHIPMVLGKNLMGEPIVMDVSTSPHLLIAGSTGSGKSVCVNSMICSILFRRSPKEVRLILVDPKIVELSIYNGIPHLLTPVIHDPKKTLKAFDFCLYEMDRRYRLLQGINARNILGYNEKITQERLARERLPYIVVVIDEFADLMHTVGKELENKVSRLAAMSRAVGIHLVLATQRPSVDVITGVIKTNIPTRIAFAVTSTTDSRIIIDEGGAEKLLGRGDMLYLASSDPTPERIQGAFLSDNEVEQVVQFASKQGVADFIDESFFEDDEPVAGGSSFDSSDSNDDESLMQEALAIVIERKSASASYLQRRLKIGYNRAARLVEQMEDLGYVGPPNGSKPRELLMIP
ncbi:MAG TPA: DNA translocase FtsK [Sphaerochaeta sp.]|nr:DNA translocase FtsK [Sphaerochaeta sp.]